VRPEDDADARIRAYAQPVRSLLNLLRVPERPPRSDYALFGVLLAWGLAEALFTDGPGERWQRVLIAIALTAPLVFRRRAPVLGLLFLAAVIIPWAYAADRPEDGSFPFPVLLVLGFSAGLYVKSTKLSLVGFLIPEATMLSIIPSPSFEGAPGATEYLILTFFVTFAWGSGRLLRRRIEQIAEAEAAGDELARDAVSAERARVARELHDVVGHSVGIIAMQAGAAEQLVEKDPAAAREHMATVRRTAQDAMREMRRLVQVLREDGVDFAPQPTLAQAEQLVDDARLAGVDAELEVEGDRRDLPPAIDLAAYRIVQEGLTNVRKHAGPVAARVRLLYADNAVYVEVRNEPGAVTANGSGGGHGLPGMRERVRIFGGEVEAGPAPTGGYVLRARLPFVEDPRQ
jgi:signal transduction histidine kinase